MFQDVHSLKELKDGYFDYMASNNKSINTVNTTWSNITSIWKNCGEEFFWHVILSDDTELPKLMNDYVNTYYPNQKQNKSNYSTSVRYFRQFLESEANAVLPEWHQAIQHKPKARYKSKDRPVLTLTGEMLEEEHKKVLADPGYGSDYALIDSILKRFPDNIDPELVALKIALIDLTNSTHIALHRQKIVVKELADIIVGIHDFDDRVRQGDPSLVPLIAKTNGSVNFFSFASKYCTYHSVNVYGNDDYVILDNVVAGALPKYVAGLREVMIKEWVRTYNYVAYKQCIDDLLDANGIFIPFRHRKLDHYLWHLYRKTK